MLTTIERPAERKLVKQQPANFIAAWSSLVIKEIDFITISRHVCKLTFLDIGV
jgi:hypothetical protein